MWSHSKKEMQVVRQTIDRKHFVVMILNNSCNILVKPLLPIRMNNCSSKFYSNHNLNVNLGIGICHIEFLLLYVSKRYKCYHQRARIFKLFCNYSKQT